MIRQNIALSLRGGDILAAVFEGESEKRRLAFPFRRETAPIGQAEAIRTALGIAEAGIVASPGGLLKALGSGTYGISSAAEADCSADRYGYHPYNRVASICFYLAAATKAAAVMHNPVSSDDLLPLNRISSMARVGKRSRYPACEHAALIWEAARMKGGKRPEETRAIVALVDDLVSVGAHVNGRCVDVNDAYGGEGPMGFTSSGDVPVAKIAAQFIKEKTTAEEMRTRLTAASGVLGYAGTDDPETLDKRAASGDAAAVLAVDVLAYQTAKWIGSAALVLRGEVDFIILSGKGARCGAFRKKLRERVGRIGEVIDLDSPDMTGYLGYVANAGNSPVNPILRY